MKRLDAHGKLVSLLCLLLLASTSLVLLAGCGGLWPDQKAADQLEAAEAFDRIVPGLTQAQDLPALGFDARTAKLLSQQNAAQRIHPSGSREHPDSAVQACIRAGAYCTGIVYPGPTSEVILLVMNGRVMHKVLLGSRTA